MVRAKHYGGDSSAHDSTGPRNKGDISRPLGAPPPDNPGVKGKASKGCAVVILAALSTAAGLIEVIRAVTAT